MRREVPDDMRLILAWTLIVGILVLSMPVEAESAITQRHVVASSTFDSGILRVERFGDRNGRHIIFIPALFCGSWEWNAQINTLSSNYDVLVVTLPGFDGRPTTQGDALMERGVQAIHLLVKTQHLMRPIIVGHSLGGTLAVLFAERYPNDAASIVTVEGGYPVAATQALRNARAAVSARPYEGIAQSALGPALRTNMLQYTITRKADVDTVERLAARSDPNAVAAWLQAALSLDLTPHLSSITVPLTVIVPFDRAIDPYQGFKTANDKRAAYVRWVSSARSGKVILVTPSRHFVMFDQPQEFAQDLQEAINR
jgi:pimeloyl-ACP methyl ester carboxylesterase